MAPNSHNAYTGRIVALVTIVVGFIGAAVPVVANLDLSSTAGIVAGIVALCAVAVKYLEGWQRYEARLDAVPMMGSRGGAVPAAAAPAEAATGAEPEPELELAPYGHGDVVSLLPDDPEDEPGDVLNRPDDDDLDDEEHELAEVG